MKFLKLKIVHRGENEFPNFPNSRSKQDTRMASTIDSVKDYYGKVLSKSEDLKTNACCTGESPVPHLREALKRVHDEVLAKYYGCGLVLPDVLDGKRVLDLGCGSGRDVYVIAQFVGASGSVVGVDMTDEQLDVANKHLGWHADKFGFANVEFKKGYIERLNELGLVDNSFDIVVSNCVINLSPDKDAVLREVFRLLKPGGELYFSDVYAEKRVPSSLREDPVLWGECLSGALYWNDFVRLGQKCGFTDPRLVKDAPITINNKTVESKIGHIRFFSATYRLFKLPGQLEPDCEDYGQAVIYKGSIEHNSYSWELDGHHEFPAGKVYPVCGNTWHMLASTRFAPHFEFIGNFENHFGIFHGCGTTMPFASDKTQDGSCC